jgi:glycogen(starch) synthase
MFGWEFPPYNRGGLGTACYGLTKGLNNQGVNVSFVLPKVAGQTKNHSSHVNLLVASNYFIDQEKLKFTEVNSLLVPYMSEEEYVHKYGAAAVGKMREGHMAAEEDVYGKDLFSEVSRYADKAKLIAALEDFDVIHAHDWMTYQAGLEAKRISGKPLVVHIHATEFDRTGGNPNQYVYDIERAGMHGADKVLAVSNWTKQKVVNHYGVPPEKVEVVHNAVTFNDNKFDASEIEMGENERMILFLGRITIQKGPDYFLYTAKKIIDMQKEAEETGNDPYGISHLDLKFVFAGTGDMEAQMIRKAAELGLSNNVLFAGWVRGRELDKLYAMADLYVMPSVSEPFGITPLEAMRNNTPCLISKQSGVSEVVSHCLKVDFWDVDEMTNKVLSVVKHNHLKNCLKDNGYQEVKKFDWNIPAQKCISAYNNVLSNL